MNKRTGKIFAIYNRNVWKGELIKTSILSKKSNISYLVLGSRCTSRYPIRLTVIFPELLSENTHYRDNVSNYILIMMYWQAIG